MNISINDTLVAVLSNHCSQPFNRFRCTESIRSLGVNIRSFALCKLIRRLGMSIRSFAVPATRARARWLPADKKLKQ